MGYNVVEKSCDLKLLCTPPIPEDSNGIDNLDFEICYRRFKELAGALQSARWGGQVEGGTPLDVNGLYGQTIKLFAHPTLNNLTLPGERTLQILFGAGLRAAPRLDSGGMWPESLIP